MTLERFTNGISTVLATDPLAQLPFPDPTAWNVYMNDMVLLPTVVGWTHTQTNGTLAVAAGTAGCGVTTQTLGGADNDLSQLYMTTATFALVDGKKLLFEVRFAVDKGAGTIGQEELFFGLCTVQTGNNFIAADGLSLTVDNCVGFVSYDGSTDINCVVRVSDAESVNLGATTYANATYYVLSWYFNGNSVIFYADGVQVAQLYSFPTAAVAPCVYVKAGEGAIKTLTADYVLVATER